jgi:2-keto-3-deoxy-L-rhamnonate aldolase RhmA
METTTVDRDIKFFFITDQPQMAAFVASGGVDRIFVDLETLGKHERQGHLNTVISEHSLKNLASICRLNLNIDVMARLNPVNPKTSDEINAAIACGADVLMLPMFRTVEEVSAFCSHVAGRARVCLLAETVDAMNNMESCIVVEGVDEVHIGFNDLSLDLGLPFMFQPLAQGLVDPIAAILRKAGMPFGMGGVARIDEGQLPAELILGEHVRLGSTAAILSRTFHRNATDVAGIENDMDFEQEVAKLRRAYHHFQSLKGEELDANHAEVVSRTASVVDRIDRLTA